MMTTEANCFPAAALPSRVGHSTLISASRALNVEIWDVEGKRYVDFTREIAVVNTSYCHPKIMAAVCTHHGEAGHVDAFLTSAEGQQVRPTKPQYGSGPSATRLQNGRTKMAIAREGRNQAGNPR